MIEKKLIVTQIFISFLFLSSFSAFAEELEVFELHPEFVYGKNRLPKIGYTPPEVFDPINDP